MSGFEGDSSTIVSLDARDIRFPTSRWLDGSDAMHPDPDYSAAYVVLHTDAGDGIEGHGLTFTIGRGNEVCVAAVRALEPLVVGRSLDEIAADMRGFWRSIASDTQLRWLGPEKGVIHLATAAVVNAVWDLWAKREGEAALEAARRHAARAARGLRRLPLHRPTPSRPPRRSSSSAMPAQEPRRASARSSPPGYPAYTTSAGWLGYSDDKVESLVGEAHRVGLHAREDEGRRRPRCGRPPRTA